MISLKKQKGFTLVELLIVIIIIGILATLVIVTFQGVQAKARDSKRQTDINALNSQIQAYYAEHGWYPTVDQLVSSTWRATNMKGLDPAALTAPGTGASIIDSNAATKTKYSYIPTESSNSGAACTDGGNVNTNDTNCDTFELHAILETDGSDFHKESN